ncbi:MAG TPA: hypothetical protein VHN81_03770 [Edaphobacter sp.]|nr:hypothetical protein [Edaphobacter sp.]
MHSGCQLAKLAANANVQNVMEREGRRRSSGAGARYGAISPADRREWSSHGCRASRLKRCGFLASSWTTYVILRRQMKPMASGASSMPAVDSLGIRDVCGRAVEGLGSTVRTFVISDQAGSVLGVAVTPAGYQNALLDREANVGDWRRVPAGATRQPLVSQRLARGTRRVRWKLMPSLS